MAAPNGNPVRRAARAATAPLRDYLNQHFEMVKEEIRTASPPAPVAAADDAAWTRLAELESVLAEQSVYQARVLARLGDDVADLGRRIGDLERVVHQLTELVAPPDPDGGRDRVAGPEAATGGTPEA